MDSVESLLMEFMSRSPDGLILLDEQLNILWVNDNIKLHMRRASGDEDDEEPSLPCNITEYCDPTAINRMIPYFEMAAKSPGEIVCVPREIHDVYDTRPLNFRISITYLSGNYLIKVENVTDQEKRTEELNNLRAKYQSLFDYYPAAVYLEELDGTIVDCNRAAELQTGYTREELLSMSSWELARPEDLEKVSILLKERLYPGAPPVVIQSFNRRKDGSIFPVEAIIQLVNINDRLYVLVVINDISDRVEMERLLAESEEKYRAVFEQARDAFIIFDRDGYVVEVNTSACEMYGYSHDEFIGVHGTSIVTEKYHSLFREFLEMVPQGVTFRGESTDRRKDGAEFNIEVVGTSITFNNDTHLLAVIRDVTNHKRLVKQLSEEREKFYLTLESIGDGVIATNTDGDIVYSNRAAEELTGYKFKDAMGKPLNEVLHLLDGVDGKRYHIPVKRILTTLKTIRIPAKTILVDRYGEKKYIDDSVAPIVPPGIGQPLGVIVILRDITEKIRLEEELIKREKLESLSVLAGGIAHDFNNLLTSVLTTLSLIKMDSDNQEQVLELIDQARHAAKRARRLTSQLLTFSKGGAPIKDATSIVELAEETASFALSGSKVKLHIEAEPDLWSAHTDESQIAQVFQNLVINAKQAMGEEGGNIWLSFHNYVHPENNETIPGIQAGDYVRILVRDDGPGIPKDIVPRLFEPFFSTKSDGHGLGLATVYSIVTQHGGHINVSSEEGKGTTFTIYLPALRKKVRRTPSGVYDSQGVGGRVLVMDDNDYVRVSLERTLKRLGYEVATAEDGAQAVEIYRKAMREGKPFDIVIMDLTVPGGLGGTYTIGELKRIDPTVKAIVSSGYFNEPVMAEYRAYGFVDRIAKPFDVSDLRRLLRKHIHRGTSKKSDTDDSGK